MKRQLLIIVALIVAAVVFLGIAIRLWEKATQPAPAISAPLGPKEKERLVIDNKGNFSRKTRDNKGNEHTKVQPGTRQVVISVDDKDQIHIFSPTKGAVAEGGLAVWGGDRVYFGIDGQLLYWRRYGLTIGAGTDMETRRHFRAFVAGSYLLPFNAVSNTSIFVGVDSRSDLIFGLRVRL